jgi:hypothetical protein
MMIVDFGFLNEEEEEEEDVTSGAGRAADRFCGGDCR